MMDFLQNCQSGRFVLRGYLHIGLISVRRVEIQRRIRDYIDRLLYYTLVRS